MADFQLYFELGFQHIADIRAYDHMVFILSLCAGYRLSEWKNLLILITAFTIGHATTLILATTNILTIPEYIIEFIIPLTILFAALYAIFGKKNETYQRHLNFYYLIILVFGFIHGMGFSNYLKAILGKSNQLVIPLLSFNLGVEMGQMFILSIVMLISFIGVELMKIKPNYWRLLLSYIAAFIAIILLPLW